MPRWSLSCLPPVLAKNNETLMREIPVLFRSLLLLLCCVVAAGQARDASSATESGRQRLTPAQWREDLQFAIDTFLVRDRSFSPAARQQFRNAIAALQQTVDVKTDDEIIVEFAKAVALARNA